MNTFYLVRHGEQVRSAGDPELSDRGVQQAKTTGHYFKDKKINTIFSSPIKRAKMTAEIMAEELSLEITVDDRLRERINWGDIPNQSFEEFLQVWRKTILDRHYQPENGDSSHIAGQRLTQAILHKATDKDNQQVILVSHGGFISDIVRSLLGDEKADQAGSSIFQSSGVSHCSVTTLTEDNGEIKVISCDNIDHITD
ncbi:phosphatase PhoE [soil metagenome]